MNATQKQAIKTAISNCQDNLYRYALAEERRPGSRTGNGESFADVIASLKLEITELEAGLND